MWIKTQTLPPLTLSISTLSSNHAFYVWIFYSCSLNMSLLLTLHTTAHYVSSFLWFELSCGFSVHSYKKYTSVLQDSKYFNNHVCKCFLMKKNVLHVLVRPEGHTQWETVSVYRKAPQGALNATVIFQAALFPMSSGQSVLHFSNQPPSKKRLHHFFVENLDDCPSHGLYFWIQQLWGELMLQMQHTSSVTDLTNVLVSQLEANCSRFLLLTARKSRNKP